MGMRQSGAPKARAKGFDRTSQAGGDQPPPKLPRIADQVGAASSQATSSPYVTRSTSCVFVPQTDSVSARLQPRTATPTATSIAPVIFTGSTPPSSVLKAITGRVQAIRPRTGV